MKFIHSSDLHLKRDLASAEGKTRFSAFQQVCDRARGADALVLAGDLFDSHDDLTDSALAEKVAAVLGGLAPTVVLIIPGNHEGLRASGAVEASAALRRLGNVRCVFKPPFERVDIAGVAFYAFPFAAGATTLDLFKGLPAPAAGELRVGVLHGTAADSGVAPAAYEEDSEEEGGNLLLFDRDLASAGFAYAALGHIHKPHRWRIKGGGEGGYPGSPCAMRVKEEEERGVLEVVLEPGVAATVKVLPLSTVRAKRAVIWVTPGEEETAIAEAEKFLSGQPREVYAAVYFEGLADRKKLDAAKDKLEARFQANFELPPVVKTHHLDDIGSVKGSPVARAYEDLLAALKARATEPGGPDPRLVSRAATLGWFALAGGGKWFSQLEKKLSEGAE
ncbi:MAG: hypothetical protein A2V88_04905 [Elusimicrobia bacterium RBG_16_66_12]|nr:MAG: hypothetical protein A2V88_04905 [Elusimicrobia bacterium RBG_16_66_12]